MSRRTWIRSGLFLSIGLAGYSLVDYASSSDHFLDDPVPAVETVDEDQEPDLAQQDNTITIPALDQQPTHSDRAIQTESAQYQLFPQAQQGVPQSPPQYNYAAPATSQLPPLPQQYEAAYQAQQTIDSGLDQQNATAQSHSHQPSPSATPSVGDKNTQLKSDEEKDLSKYASAFNVPDRNSQPSITDADDKLLNSASKPNGEMDAAAKRAQAGLEKAMQLAERGALHSARAEFLKALQTSIQALDWQKGTNIHQQSFQNGWKTLEELEDFYPQPGQPITSIDEIIGRHSSRIVSHQEGKPTSLNQATTDYIEYASEQLSLAGGDFLPAADALFGLAKVYQIESTSKTEKHTLDSIRAEALYRACLKIEPRHAMAANELGVMLGKQGKFKDAKDALQLSASLSAHPSTWKNLAIVHQDLGEFQLAQLAQREGDLAEKRWQNQYSTPGQPSGGAVAIVDNRTFARSTPANIHNPSVPAQTAPTNNLATNQNREVAQNPRYRTAQQPPQTRTADGSSPQAFSMKR